MTDLAMLKAWNDACEKTVRVTDIARRMDLNRADACFAIAEATQRSADLLWRTPSPPSEEQFRLALIASEIEHAADMRLWAQIVSEGSPQPYALKRLADRAKRRLDHLSTFIR